MKKCNDCNVEMVEAERLHTDYVGGARMEERIYVDYDDEENGFTPLLGNKKISIKMVRARVCPQCGKVELYVDLNADE